MSTQLGVVPQMCSSMSASTTCGLCFSRNVALSPIYDQHEFRADRVVQHRQVRNRVQVDRLQFFFAAGMQDECCCLVCSNRNCNLEHHQISVRAGRSFGQRTSTKWEIHDVSHVHSSSTGTPTNETSVFTEKWTCLDAHAADEISSKCCLLLRCVDHLRTG